MGQILKTLLLLLSLLFSLVGKTQVVREYMDLQTHPTMHMAYPFFGKGLQFFEEGDEPKLSYKHLFKNVNYANFLHDNAGARILVHGAIVPEIGISPKRARALALKQIKFVNDFAAAHGNQFAVARNPLEVRDLVFNTDKTIFIHSLEGAKKLVNSQEDAFFWADQGIAFVTLIHLMDDHFGGAATAPDMVTRVINYKESLRLHPQKGLTEKGKQAILWLTRAGIMTDLTHMGDQSRKDALTLMEAHRIPPIVTHDLFKPIQNQPRGVEKADLLRIYQLNGFFSLPISGFSTLPHDPDPDYQRRLDELECHCPGSVDSYKFTYEMVQEFIEGHAGEILGDASLKFKDLTETQKEALAIGFQSDFNGWLDHSRPRYGEAGCFSLEEGKAYEEIELVGMPHPGLLASQWRWLEKEGVDLSPLKRSAEKFLQVWEQLLMGKAHF